MADVSTFLQSCWILATLLCLLPPTLARCPHKLAYLKNLSPRLAPDKLAEVLSRDTALRLRLFCR